MKGHTHGDPMSMRFHDWLRNDAAEAFRSILTLPQARYDDYPGVPDQAWISRQASGDASLWLYRGASFIYAMADLGVPKRVALRIVHFFRRTVDQAYTSAGLEVDEDELAERFYEADIQEELTERRVIEERRSRPSILAYLPDLRRQNSLGFEWEVYLRNRLAAEATA